MMLRHAAGWSLLALLILAVVLVVLRWRAQRRRDWLQRWGNHRPFRTRQVRRKRR